MKPYFYIGIMKTKPVLIIIACLAVALCLFFFVKAKYFSKPERGEITQFLTDFNYELQGGHTDTILTYFEKPKNIKAINLLIKVLSGKTGLNGKSAATFKISLDAANNKILFSNSQITIAEVPVIFTADNIPGKTASITFTIHKVAGNVFKIAAVKTDIFIKAYIAYANLVRGKTVPETAIYAAITLASFKTADSLKAKYDSVLWFDHIGNKTYYYVIKGIWDGRFLSSEQPPGYKPDYKMGLVGPDLKEIIPPGYDLIHNIDGTIDGLIEVEKDGKRGFYNLAGKIVLPVNYDQIFPLNDNENMALLRNGDDYFYLKRDSTITDKIQNFKIADILLKIKTFGDSYTLTEKSSKNIMEYNSRDYNNSVVIAPSYLVDLQIMPASIDLPNPLRKDINKDEDEDGSASLEVDFDGTKQDDGNWFESVFYSLYNDYLGGRGGLYQTENVVIADKRQNRLLAYNAAVYDGDAEGGVLSSNKCSEKSVRAINDSLFEFRMTAQFDQPMLSDTITEGIAYHYLQIKNGRLTELPGQRVFNCTKYVKLDDSYLQGCYIINSKVADHVTPEILEYMKNEIYASYNYKFKNDAWNQVFEQRFSESNNDKQNINVDDSLTVIDKYNINWINQKLKGQDDNKLAAR